MGEMRYCFGMIILIALLGLTFIFNGVLIQRRYDIDKIKDAVIKNPEITCM